MKLIIFLLAFPLAVWTFAATAQDEDLQSLTLEDLLDVKTEVTGKRAVSTRSASGIVSVLTEEDIVNSGARDLIDLLRTVPSISFGFDVQGVAGIGARGLWAHEGKSLLIIDGIEMNELQYGTTQFGNRFPIDQIKKIEIIRGPGSVIYGGFAELMVINITTKGAQDLNGISGSVTYGQFEKTDKNWEFTESRANYSLLAAHQFGEAQVSAGFYFGDGLRGSGLYQGSDDAGSMGAYQQEKGDELLPEYANLGVKYKGLTLRYLRDYYKITTRSMFGYTSVDRKIPEEFLNDGYFASYQWVINESFKLTPQVMYTEQRPWRQLSDEAMMVLGHHDLISKRFKAGLNLDYDLSQKMHFLLGYEYIEDKHHIDVLDEGAGPTTFANGKADEQLSSRAVYFQTVYKMSWAELTAGIRYEEPSKTDTSTVPRFALIRREDNWHAKALYSQAFRSPVLFNYEARPDIEPEKTQTIEVEYGHRVGTAGYLTVNLFDTIIKDPIVYYYDVVLDEDQYDNFDRVGTRGLELIYKYKPSWGRLNIGYSYYEAADNKVDTYAVTDDDKALRGMPQHQATLQLTKYLGGGKDKRLNAIFHYMSEKSAQDYDLESDVFYERELPAVLLVDLIYSVDDVWIKNLGFSVGMYNVFDQQIYYAQPFVYQTTPYASGHSPVPGPSRELAASVQYKFEF